MCVNSAARSLARLNCAGLRDDAREKHTEIQIEPLPVAEMS
jgi:hypothetical protein